MMRQNTSHRIPVTGTCLALLLLGHQAAISAENRPPAADVLDGAWKHRAQAARKKLSKPGLDACDGAVERGFEQFQMTRSKDERTYSLRIRINGQTMTASYVYRGARLGEFVVSALPPRWLAVQKANSKTLSVLVGDANCALDLCTNNPFSDGPCPK